MARPTKAEFEAELDDLIRVAILPGPLGFATDANPSPLASDAEWVRTRPLRAALDRPKCKNITRAALARHLTEMQTFIHHARAQRGH